MSDPANEATTQTGTDTDAQVKLAETAEPQTQGQQDAQPGNLTPSTQQPPEAAQNRGEDAVDIASMGSMIASDPPSSLMSDEE